MNGSTQDNQTLTGAKIWCSISNTRSSFQEEYEKIGNEIDNEIARMIWEHSFDDVKEIHEKYPWLTVEECKEFLDCCERMEEYKAPALVLLLDWKDFKRCCELEELNKYRKENVESEF